jgi:hypothetical protein
MVRTFRRIEDLERIKEKEERRKMRRFRTPDELGKIVEKYKDLRQQKRNQY